jgi:hypothetical protein
MRATEPVIFADSMRQTVAMAWWVAECMNQYYRHTSDII